METKDKYTLQSVDNALRILEYFQIEPNPTLSDISSGLGIGKSSAFRLLNTLGARNFVSKDRDGRYSLGIKNLALGRIVTDNAKTLHRLRPLFAQLVNYTGESLHFCVWCDDIRVILQELLLPSGTVDPPNSRWAARFAHMTATGMALLAIKSDEEIERYIKNVDLVPKTPYSLSLIHI